MQRLIAIWKTRIRKKLESHEYQPGKGDEKFIPPAFDSKDKIVLWNVVRGS